MIDAATLAEALQIPERFLTATDSALGDFVEALNLASEAVTVDTGRGARAILRPDGSPAEAGDFRQGERIELREYQVGNMVASSTAGPVFWNDGSFFIDGGGNRKQRRAARSSRAGTR
jgi:hypothetical protein